MKILTTLLLCLKRNHELSIRRSRIHYRNRQKAAHHTQLHFETILK
ncbi:MAG: hypothetical protein QNL33_15360 [Akkermansiaceae bacterium]